MSVMAGAKAGWGALKSHWLFFAILISVLILLAINYDAKNKTFTGWKDKVATWPIVGGLFTAFAILFVSLNAVVGVQAVGHVVTLARMVG